MLQRAYQRSKEVQQHELEPELERLRSEHRSAEKEWSRLIPAQEQELRERRRDAEQEVEALQKAVTALEGKAIGDQRLARQQKEELQEEHAVSSIMT